jgi:hypothetical protein
MEDALAVQWLKAKFGENTVCILEMMGKCFGVESYPYFDEKLVTEFRVLSSILFPETTSGCGKTQPPNQLDRIRDPDLR